MNASRPVSTFKDLNTGTKITSRDEIDVLFRTFAVMVAKLFEVYSGCMPAE